MSKTSPTIQNSFIGSKANFRRAIRSGGFVPVRVTDISLGPSTNGKSTFQNSNGWYGIGAIRFEPLTKGSFSTEFPQGNIAYPLDINYRNTPLINEVVYVILGPSNKRSKDGESDALDFYYTSTINLFNSVHLNPDPPKSPPPTSQINDTGIEQTEDDVPQKPKYGNFFEEIPYIKNLYPQEGDVIFEGRFGQSIRFSSTMVHPSESKNIESPWSTAGSYGQPITILRNGSPKPVINKDNWFPTYENIQQDDSSIYMTSGQTLNIAYGSTLLGSYGKDLVPAANTSKKFQTVDLKDDTKPPKESDATGSQIDLVLQEADLSTEITGSNG